MGRFHSITKKFVSEPYGTGVLLMLMMLLCFNGGMLEGTLLWELGLFPTGVLFDEPGIDGNMSIGGGLNV